METREVHQGTSCAGELSLTLDARRLREAKEIEIELADLENDDVVERFRRAVGEGEHHLIAPIVNRLGSADDHFPDGLTPLLAACIQGDSHVVEALLDSGANPNRSSDGRSGASVSPLFMSIYFGNFRSAKLLLDHGADPALGAPDGVTPLEALKAKTDVPTDATVEDLGSLLAREVKVWESSLPDTGLPLSMEEEKHRLELARRKRSREVAALVTRACARLQEDATDLEALVELGRCYDEQKLYSDALQYGLLALKAAPRSGEALLLTADARRRLGHHEDAIAMYGKALEIMPRSVRALRGRATSYRDLKEFDAAERDIAVALDVDRNDASTHNSAGLIAMAQGDGEAARNSFDRATELDVRLKYPYYNRARLLWEREEFAAAIDEISLAIACDPLFSGAYNRRGFYRRQLGDVDALSDFGQALAAAAAPSERALPEYNMGLIKLDVGNPMAAIPHFNRSIAYRPNYAPSYAKRADARTASGFGGGLSDRKMAAALDGLDSLIDRVGEGTLHAPLRADSVIFQRGHVLLESLTTQGYLAFQWEEDDDVPVTLGRILLCTLATGNHEPLLRALLAHGIEVNITSPDGLTPLHLAAAHSDNELVIWRLIQAGADLEAKAPDGRTPVDVLLKRATETGFLKDGLEDFPGDAEIDASRIPELVERAIRESIHNDIEQLASLEQDHNRELQQDLESEAAISQAEIMIGAAAAQGESGHIDRLRQVDRYARERKARTQLRGMTQASVAAMELIGHLNDKLEAIYEVDAPERLLLSERARQNVAWIPQTGENQ